MLRKDLVETCPEDEASTCIQEIAAVLIRGLCLWMWASSEFLRFLITREAVYKRHDSRISWVSLVTRLYCSFCPMQTIFIVNWPHAIFLLGFRFRKHLLARPGHLGIPRWQHMPHFRAIHSHASRQELCSARCKQAMTTCAFLYCFAPSQKCMIGTWKLAHESESTRNRCGASNLFSPTGYSQKKEKTMNKWNKVRQLIF